jgi:UDP-3-O-[3-hydroxymyristoyl] glucosamine N-acyltransferase
MSRALPLADLVALVEGEVSAAPSGRQVSGVATLDAAGSTDLSFVAAPRYLPYLAGCRAAAVLVSADLEAGQDEAGPLLIRVDDPHAALARVIPVLYPEPEAPQGVHPAAVVAEGAVVGQRASIAAGAVIGDGARIGAGSVIGEGCVIGEGVVVGEECRLHPGVTLYSGVTLGDRCILHSGVRLGCDGFGYAFTAGEHRKIRHVGGCRIGNDVEIGANSTVDRGSVGDTVIGPGTKIDNLVHIGHNVRMGAACIVVAQVGISGSTRIGNGVVIGGQAGIAGHLTIGDGARIGAQAGVTADIPAGQAVSGYPARPHREALRAQASLFKLPALAERLRNLERRLDRDDL